jgi:hypothetical protein
MNIFLRTKINISNRGRALLLCIGGGWFLKYLDAALSKLDLGPNLELFGLNCGQCCGTGMIFSVPVPISQKLRFLWFRFHNSKSNFSKKLFLIPC